MAPQHRKKFVFDIETDVDTNEVLIIGLITDKEEIVFRTMAGFLGYAIKLAYSEKFDLYAHYGGGFDFLFVLQEIKESDDKFFIKNVLDINGLIFQMVLERFGIELKFRDSFALFRCGLNTLAENLLDEKKLDVDRLNVKKLSWEEQKEYVLSDCRLLMDCLNVFEDEIGAKLQLTTPMQSLNNFRENWCDYKFQKLPEYHIENFGNWYFGGHTEVFKRQGKNVNYYDITNCYGHAMRNYGAIVGQPTFVDKRRDSISKRGLYRVKILTDKFIPHAPIRFDDKLYFLNSRDNIFNVTSLDLDFFEHFGIDYEILDGMIFDYIPDFFKGYVDYWYEQRFKSEKLKFISKLFINGLYGKFGQRIERDSCAIAEDCDFYYDIDLKLGRKTTKSISWFNQPQIALWVTSAARCVLHSYLYKYQNNLYYCDTDSLMIDTEIEKKDLGVNELGKLKLEKKYDRAYFLAPKFYGGKINGGKFESKNKGFNTSFREIKFRKAMKGENPKTLFKLEYNRIAKFKTALRTSDNFVANYHVSKKTNSFNLKRKLLGDGINTLPYTLKKGKLK